MRWIPFIIVLAVFMLVASSSVLDFISFGDYNIKPELMLIVMVFFAINCETSEAMACSFAIGLAADISSSSMVMGPHTVSFGIIGTAISFLRGQVIMKRLIFQAICIFVSGLLAGTMAEAMIYRKLSGQTLNSFAVIVMTTLYSALIGPLIWLGLKAIFNMLVIEPPHYARQTDR
ncbi:MAG: rod shape-determining protein MreD [Planctomycetes bacterium]|nr:rod shape-determining protein MreD [Planctomycetota bacterium]